MSSRLAPRVLVAPAPQLLLLPFLLLGLALIQQQASALTEYLDAAAIARTEVVVK